MKRSALALILCAALLVPARVGSQTQVKVPNVVGMKLFQARQTIRLADLVPTVRRRDSSEPPGTILAQRPKAGRRINDGRNVKLFVARTPEDGGSGGAAGSTAPVNPGTPSDDPGSSTDPVIAAAGDIACDPTSPDFNGGQGTATACRQMATSDLVVNSDFDAVLTLGDNQYEDGTLSEFMASYDPSWGRVKAITHPSVGNHEYHVPGATGYFDYFGAAAGDPTKGYYSYDLGTWHVIVINSQCEPVGGCGTGSPQLTWLAQELAAEASHVCTLAYWHHPRFSSGPHGNQAHMAAVWQTLYQHGADVVLNGHDHSYERFAEQDPSAQADPTGIRQFTVGTGGNSLYPFLSIQPNSEVRNSTTYGILEMTLHPSGYDWEFLPVGGTGFTDSGTDTCH